MTTDGNEKKSSGTGQKETREEDKPAIWTMDWEMSFASPGQR